MKKNACRGVLAATFAISTICTSVSSAESRFTAPSSEFVQQETASKSLSGDISSTINNYEDKIYKLAGSGLTIRLDPTEKALIELKKREVIKYLAEQQELKPVISALQSNENAEKYESIIREKTILSPKQIMELRLLLLSIEEAENKPIAGPINLNIESIDYNIDDQKPIVVRVSKGYASSLVFFDKTGQPWPVEGDVIGDSLSFKAKPNNVMGNIIVFEITKNFSESNALLNLKGMHSPVVLKLVSDNENIDTRLSVRIPRNGPHAKTSVFIAPELSTNDPRLMSILSGKVSQLTGLKRYKLSGVKGEAIYHKGSLYIRSREMLASPPSKQSAKSVTGQYVYKIPPVSQLIFSVDGRLVNATIEKSGSILPKSKVSIFEE